MRLLLREGGREMKLHASPYTKLESCEVCWADEEETEIIVYKGVPYCATDLNREIESERGINV